jgi:hypothetical protein
VPILENKAVVAIVMEIGSKRAGYDDWFQRIWQHSLHCREKPTESSERDSSINAITLAAVLLIKDLIRHVDGAGPGQAERQPSLQL